MRKSHHGQSDARSPGLNYSTAIWKWGIRISSLVPLLLLATFQTPTEFLGNSLTPGGKISDPEAKAVTTSIRPVRVHHRLTGSRDGNGTMGDPMAKQCQRQQPVLFRTLGARLTTYLPPPPPPPPPPSYRPRKNRGCFAVCSFVSSCA